jgi:LacI family transcriptional regulator
MKPHSAPATMQSVAAKLGLSRLTVSSVVNGKARQRGIAAATAERVRAYLKQSGFIPSRQATLLRAGKRESVGILYCGRLYSHLTEAFNLMVGRFADQPAGLELMVVRREDLEKGLVELIARRVSKLVWIHTLHPETELREKESLLGLLANIQTVAIYNYNFDVCGLDAELAARGIHLIGVSRRKAYQQLALFLKSLGHHTVAFPDVADADSSKIQFVSVFKENGFTTLTVPHARPVNNDPEQYAALLAQHMVKARQLHPVTAACFLDDDLAGFALREFMKIGVRIPADLTVTGFDGLRLAGSFAVPLTTLGLPVDRMVRRVESILQKSPPKYRHCFEIELVKRESHGQARVI